MDRPLWTASPGPTALDSLHVHFRTTARGRPGRSLHETRHSYGWLFPLTAADDAAAGPFPRGAGRRDSNRAWVTGPSPAMAFGVPDSRTALRLVSGLAGQFRPGYRVWPGRGCRPSVVLPEAWARLGKDGPGVRARGDAGGQVVKLLGRRSGRQIVRCAAWPFGCGRLRGAARGAGGADGGEGHRGHPGPLRDAEVLAEEDEADESSDGGFEAGQDAEDAGWHTAEGLRGGRCRAGPASASRGIVRRSPSSRPAWRRRRRPGRRRRRHLPAADGPGPLRRGVRAPRRRGCRSHSAAWYRSSRPPRPRTWTWYAHPAQPARAWCELSGTVGARESVRNMRTAALGAAMQRGRDTGRTPWTAVRDAGYEHRVRLQDHMSQQSVHP